MKYNHFSMLPERAFQKRAFGGMTLEGGGGSGGGSSGPTQSTVTNTNIPEYARPYVENMLGATQQQLFNISPYGDITGIKPYTPYSTDPTAYVAGFSPMQQQAFRGVAGLEMPIQYGAATGATAEATQRALEAGYQPGYFENQYQAPRQYAPGQFSMLQAQAPELRQYQMGAPERVRTGTFTQPGTAEAYMSPYLQQALAPQLAEIQRQSDVVQQNLRGQATASGAFGGTRQALQAAEQERNKQALMSQAVGQGYQGAYQQAMQQYSTDAARRMQAALANQQAGLTAGGQNLQALLGVQQLGAGQNLQAQLANQQAYQAAQQAAEQSRQYGAGLGLQGLQLGLAGAGQLAGLGGQELQAQQGILGLQQQYGAMQQAQQQNIINQAIQNYATAQQYPQQQLAFMNAMLRGLPLQTATTQTYQAAPSPISQLAGLGTAAYGAAKLFGKKGGMPKDFEKKYAGGGITDINRKVLMTPEKYSAETLQRSMQDGVVNPLVARLAMEENADFARRAQAGIDQANINPEMFNAAGGGIVAFNGEDESLVKDQIAKEEKEIAAGTRLDYSPEVKATLMAPRQEKEGAYKAKERAAMLGRGREIAKESANLVPPRPTPAAMVPNTPAGIAAAPVYADEGSRGTAKGIVDPRINAPGKTAAEWGIGLTPAAPETKPETKAAEAAAPTKKSEVSDYDEFLNLLNKAGVSKDPYAEDRAAVKEMKEKVAKDKEEAKYMALMQAGLGMMGGKSQYALQNIGEGAKEGATAYGKSMQEIKADEKEYAKINRELTKAEDALKRGNVKEYLEFKDKAEQRAIALRGVQAQEKSAAKAPAEIQLIERYAAEKKIPFSQALKEITTLKAEPKSRTQAEKEWSESPILQRNYPKFEDYYSSISGASRFQGFSAKPLGQ